MSQVLSEHFALGSFNFHMRLSEEIRCQVTSRDCSAAGGKVGGLNPHSLLASPRASPHIFWSYNQYPWSWALNWGLPGAQAKSLSRVVAHTPSDTHPIFVFQSLLTWLPFSVAPYLTCSIMFKLHLSVSLMGFKTPIHLFTYLLSSSGKHTQTHPTLGVGAGFIL